MKLSFIIPALNEEAYIRSCLESLQAYRHKGHEVILVDGGSTDQTVDIASPLVDRIIHSESGRARQMNAGAKQASGEIFLFVHADTILGQGADTLLANRVRSNMCWGRFDVRLSGPGLPLRVIEFFINLRSRLTGIATGDQVIFITRLLFLECGGFPEIPIMEDVTLSRTLVRLHRPVCLRNRVITSSRRWEQNGVFRTVIGMWYLRLIYFLGTDPEKLARRYG